MIPNPQPQDNRRSTCHNAPIIGHLDSPSGDPIRCSQCGEICGQKDSIEEIAQKITDCFFQAGARISRTHYDFVVEKLSRLQSETEERVKSHIIKQIEEIVPSSDTSKLTSSAAHYRVGYLNAIDDIKNLLKQ